MEVAGGDAMIQTRCNTCETDQDLSDGQGCPRCGAPHASTPAADPRITPAPSHTTMLLPLADSAPEVSAAEPVRWWLKHGERWQMLIGVVALVLCCVALGGYLITVKINNARFPPEKPVAEFFGALAARDGAAAAELAGCEAPSCAEAMSAGYEPPTDVHITSVTYGVTAGRKDRSTATVQVSYRLAGTGQQHAEIRVRRHGTLLTRPFRIESGASGQVVLTAPHVDRVHLGALEVTVADEQRSALRAGGPVRLLPGSYIARLRGDDPLFTTTGGQTLVDVTAQVDDLERPLPIAMGVQIRDDVIAAVNEHVEQTVAACVQQSVANPRGCSFQIPGVVIGAQQIEWTVLRLPQVRVDVVDDPVPGRPQAVVRTVTPGQVQVTYNAITSASGARQQFTHLIPLTARGEVTAERAGAAPAISLRLTAARADD